MATPYTNYLKVLSEGTVDFTTATIKRAMYQHGTYTFSNTHEFLDDVISGSPTNEVVGTNYERKTLARTLTGTTTQVWDIDEDPQYAQSATGFSNAGGYVDYIEVLSGSPQTADDTVSILICHFGFGGSRSNTQATLIHETSSQGHQRLRQV